jgi:hypothetical protein
MGDTLSYPIADAMDKYHASLTTFGYSPIAEAAFGKKLP